MRCLVLVFIVLVSASAKLEDVFEWKLIPFAWENHKQKTEYIQDRLYIEKNNVPIAIQKWHDKLFIPLTRWKRGVASTLNYISLSSTQKSPSLIPYPSWEANKLMKVRTTRKLRMSKKEEKIASVFRVKIDSCDRLWLVDTGVLNDFEARQIVAKPAIVIYDLKTDKILRKYELKTSDFVANSAFVNIIVDSQPNSCDKTFAYILDSIGYSMVVYSFERNDSWRIKHPFFSYDPIQTDYSVHGVQFQWDDGIFGGALSNSQENGYRTLYFHSFSSTKEFSVSTEVLQNQTLVTNPSSFKLFKLVGDKGEKSHSSSAVFDARTEIMYFPQIQKNGIACWNTKKPLTPENFHLLIKDDERLVYPNDMFIDEDGYLWILSNRLAYFFYSNIDFTSQHFNFRVMKIKIDDIIKDTPCQLEIEELEPKIGH